MGRRKIEIKAIKDDRNRSVTFLKRKGGLFKKAHELSVLCSVEVAVIVFAHNKKLHEYSSGDISATIERHQHVRRCGGAHEHKGPEDYAGKADGDDDEDGGDDNLPPQQLGSQSPPDQAMLIPQQHLQHQQFQHMHHATPSASPPMPNGVSFRRCASPQPQPQHQGVTRPSSRAQIGTSTMKFAPAHFYPSHSVPPMQNGYGYRPTPHLFTGQQPQDLLSHASLVPPHLSMPQYAHTQLMHTQVPPGFTDSARRLSMPPNFTQPQPDHRRRQASTVHPPSQPEAHGFQGHPMPLPKPLPTTVKNHNNFTPIDDSRSLLAQHWRPSTTTTLSMKEPPAPSAERPPPAIDHVLIGNMDRLAPQQPTPASLPNPPQRTPSASSLPPNPPPPLPGSGAPDAKRPRLKVQIPDEHSEAENTHVSVSPITTNTAEPVLAKGGAEASMSSGMVLPPPSPSASSLLSAGATGPPNPFARPAPPATNANNSTSQHNRSDNMETPMSALPSRFLENGIIPSPSTFYSEWGFGGHSSNMLPSPLTFQTPVAPTGPGFRDDPEERKRKTSEDSDSGAAKRPKA